MVSHEGDVHDLVAALPGVPSFYGRNLDALWDTLTGLMEGPVEIRIAHPDALRDAVGNDYYARLLRVFEDAAREAEGVTFVLVKEENQGVI